MSPRITCGDNNTSKQVLSSSWDGRPFGHNRHGQKIGSCAPFGGGAGFHVTQCGLGRGLPSYQVASDPSSRFATHTDEPKFNGLCPLGVKLLPGLRPTTVPSGILIHPSVWPQQTSAKNGSCAPFLGRGTPCPRPQKGGTAQKGGGGLAPHLAQCGLDLCLSVLSVCHVLSLTLVYCG